MPRSRDRTDLDRSANELPAACLPHHGSQNLHAFQV
jgi:hypothetical protein